MHESESRKQGQDIEAKRDVVRDIKVVLDDIVWRSLTLGSGVLKQYELTLQQALALGAIVRLGPDLDMGKIAESTLLPASTVTSVVDRLMERGLVERRAHPSDRRRVIVGATRAGHYLVSEMEEQDLGSWRWIASELDPDDLDVMLRAFTHLRDRLEQMRPEDFTRHGRSKTEP